MSSTPAFEGKPSENSYVCCEKIKSEICERKSEISSYEEIIKLLHKKLSEKGLPKQITSSTQNGYYV
jgi:hypothetical protein